MYFGVKNIQNNNFYIFSNGKMNENNENVIYKSKARA